MGVINSHNSIKGPMKFSNLPESIQYIWEEYLTSCRNNSSLYFQMTQKALQYRNKVLNYDVLMKGIDEENKKNIEQVPLYLILHHGGIGQASYNNGEYIRAKMRYANLVQKGIIVGVRGVTDYSNMHYNHESIILLDRLIKNLIWFSNVDPNRVYLIGIGFGGDGVYQIINLLSSRFAAAVVISGHSYGKSLKNILNIPLLIQVGENDYYFEKNIDAVKTYKRIKTQEKNFIAKCKRLSKNTYNTAETKENIIYATSSTKKNASMLMTLTTDTSSKTPSSLYGEKESCVECYIHAGQSQDINDYDKINKETYIIEDPVKWMTVKTTNYPVIKKNVNSILFLNRHIREPFPKALYWDLTCTMAIPQLIKKQRNVDENLYTSAATFSGDSKKKSYGGFHYSKAANDEKILTTNFNRYFYWLEIGEHSVSSLGGLEVMARMDSKNNTFYIDSPIRFLRILVNDKMMDLDKEIWVGYNGRKKSLRISKNFKTERRTLNERGDYTYIFSVCIDFESKDLNNFRISQLEET